MTPEILHMAMAIIVVPVFVFVGFELYDLFVKYRQNKEASNRRDIQDAISAQQSGFPIPSEVLDRIESDGR